VDPQAPAAPPERPEARFQRARNQDSFEAAAPRTGPELQPSAPPIQPRTQVQVTDKQAIEVTQTVPTDSGGKISSTVSSRGSELTAGVSVEQPGGVGGGVGVTVSDKGMGPQGSLTTAGGNTYSGGVTVTPAGDSFTLSGETKQSNGDEGNVTATVGQEGFSLGGERTSQGVTRQAGVEVTADGIRGSAGASVKVPGGFSFQFNASGGHSSQTQSEGGFTTTSVEGDLSLQVGGKVGVAGASAGLSYTETSRTSFEVRLPDADAARVAAGEAPQPNPYDPETIPEGGSVFMRDREISTTSETAGYRGAELGGSLSEEQADSLMVERTGSDTVRVTVGTEQALEDSFRMGYSLGPASVRVGSTDRLEASELQRAEFNLSTEEGRAAYSEAIATRELPQDNGSGVSNVELIQQGQGQFGAEVSASLGPWSVGLNGNISVDRTSTTRADGSRAQTTSLDSTASVPIRLQQSFGPDGTEQLSQAQLTMNLRNLDPDVAASLQRAITGERAGAGLGPQDMELTLTHNDVRQLREQAQARIDQRGAHFDPTFPEERLLQGIALSQNLGDLAFVLHHHDRGSDGVADLLQGIHASAGGQLPGSVTVSANE